MKNRNHEVIPARMRDKTGRGMRVRAFGDEVIHLDRESFDEEGRNVYRTIHKRHCWQKMDRTDSEFSHLVHVLELFFSKYASK